MASLHLSDLVKQWFYKSDHTKNWLLDGIQFAAKGPHSQKGYVFIEHDHIEIMRYHQYGGGRLKLAAADPFFFEKLDKLLEKMIL